MLIDVIGVNDRPQGVNDSFTVTGATSLTIGPSGVLSNDFDIEGSALTASLLAGPSKGTVTLNSDGSFTYIAAVGFDNGTDSFTYSITDGQGGQDA